MLRAPLSAVLLFSALLGGAAADPVRPGAPGDDAAVAVATIPAALPAEGLTRDEARQIAARGARPVQAMTNTCEASSPDLRAALAGVQRAPGAASYHRAADAYLGLGIRDQAFDQLEAALRLDSRDAAAHDGMARIWRDWGWLPQALSAAHRAVYYAPGSSIAWNTLGTILERVRTPEGARRAYQRAVVLDATAWWAHVNLCALALSEDRLDQAQYECEWAFDLQVRDPLLDELMERIQRRRSHAGAPRVPASR